MIRKMVMVWCDQMKEILPKKNSNNNNNNNRFTALCPGLLGWASTRRNTHPPSWSSSSLYQLLPSTTIHSLLLVQLRAWQSFCTTSFHVLFGLPLGLEPSTSYSIHFFTQSVSFHSTCPYHHNLFCCSINIISSIENSNKSVVILSSENYYDIFCNTNFKRVVKKK